MRGHRGKAAAAICAGAVLATAGASAPAGGAVHAAQAARTRAVVVDCVEQPQVRPGRFIIACGDGNDVLTSLRWSHWRSAAALGSGQDMVNDCVPYCAAGHFHSYPVTVRLDRLRPWQGHPGQWHYTRLNVHYVAHTPAHIARDVTIQLWN